MRFKLLISLFMLGCVSCDSWHGEIYSIADGTRCKDSGKSYYIRNTSSDQIYEYIVGLNYLSEGEKRKNERPFDGIREITLKPGQEEFLFCEFRKYDSGDLERVCKIIGEVKVSK